MDENNKLENFKWDKSTFVTLEGGRHCCARTKATISAELEGVREALEKIVRMTEQGTARLPMPPDGPRIKQVARNAIATLARIMEQK